MPTARELYTAGRLDSAIEALGAELRNAPTDAQRRTFLFELLTFAGQYDRAEKQLDVLARGGTDAELAVLPYRAALKAERVREHMFATGDFPTGARAGAGRRDAQRPAVPLHRGRRPARRSAPRGDGGRAVPVDPVRVHRGGPARAAEACSGICAGRRRVSRRARRCARWSSAKCCFPRSRLAPGGSTIPSYGSDGRPTGRARRRILRTHRPEAAAGRWTSSFPCWRCVNS